MMYKIVQLIVRYAGIFVYELTQLSLTPLHWGAFLLYKNAVKKRSVLHISYSVHIAYHTVQQLREAGVNADYLAIGESPVWHKSDFQYISSRFPWRRAWREFLLFWNVIAQYEVVHCHFMLTPSRNGWELAMLRRLGRRVVIHYRGCEVRNREENMRRYPHCNICQNCDYKATACSDSVVVRRRRMAKRYGSAFLITTPDLADFAEGAQHLPFFQPSNADLENALRNVSWTDADRDGIFTIVHATNHPGIEGTDQIRQAIQRLREKGYQIRFRFLKDASHDIVLAATAQADVTIGKMKMGYYANAQIESLSLGVPAITYVRPEYITPAIQESGLILSTLDDLEATLETLLRDRELLEQKRRIAKSSVAKLHNNRSIVTRLCEIYWPDDMAVPATCLEAGKADHSSAAVAARAA